MRVGTKSLLVGVHQVFLHPIFVTLAWRKLYGHWPSWKELVCIVVHDWGYWGCPNMDGEEGERHPQRSAAVAFWCVPSFGLKEYELILLHSRHLARQMDAEPSKLCWPDKLCLIYVPWWMYIPLGLLSGEIWEYRRLAHNAGFIPLTATHRTWYAWIQERLVKLATEQRGDAVPYVNPVRGNP